MGITLQRVIDQNKAALAWEAALKEYIRRIHIQLEQDPEDIRLLTLAAIPLHELFDSYEEYTQTITAVARESESIRLTQGRTIRRHLRRSPPSVPDLTEFPEESLIEKRGRLFRESFEHTPHDSLKDPFSSSQGLETDKPSQVLNKEKPGETK
jgi:hypothetical protein